MRNIVLLSLIGILFAATTTRAANPTSKPTTSPTTLPTGWKNFPAGNAFTFAAPEDFKNIPEQGIDSFVGRFGNASLELSFDFGPYSNSLREFEHEPGVVITQENIDGHAAKVVAFGNHVYVYFAKVSVDVMGTNKLEMGVTFKPPATHPDALAVIRSITFPPATARP